MAEQTLHFVWEVSQKGLVPGLVQLGSDWVPWRGASAILCIWRKRGRPKCLVPGLVPVGPKWVPWRDGSNFSLHFCTISQHARSFSSHNTHLGRLASPDEKQTAIWQTYGTAHACLILSGMSWFRTFEKKTKCVSVNSPWAGQMSS